MYALLLSSRFHFLVVKYIYYSNQYYEYDYRTSDSSGDPLVGKMHRCALAMANIVAVVYTSA